MLNREARSLDLVKTSQRLCLLAREEGVKLAAAPKDYFTQYEAAEQLAILDTLQFYCDLIEDTKKRGEKCVFNRAYSWNALALLGLVAPEDWYERIEDFDTVEIVDKDQVTVFRNFEFHRYTSYSFDEVLFSKFGDLFQRQTISNESIWNEIFEKGLFNQNRSCVDFEVPVHRIQEKYASGKIIIAKYKFVTPLCDRAGELKAAAIVSDFRFSRN